MNRYLVDVLILLVAFDSGVFLDCLNGLTIGGTLWKLCSYSLGTVGDDIGKYWDPQRSILSSIFI